MRDPIKDIDGWPCACWWCAGELVWDSDADSGDIGEEPGRLVTFLHCKACGAEVLYKEPEKC